MFWIPNITTLVLAWLIQCIILSRFILTRHFTWINQNTKHWLIKGGKIFFQLTLANFSLILLDTSVKLIILLIRYDTPLAPHLSSIILTCFLAIELLTLILVLTPNLKKIIIFSVMLIVFLMVFEFYLNVANLDELNVFGSKYSPMLFGMGVPLMFGIMTSIFFTLTRIFFKNCQNLLARLTTPFWNKTEKMNKIWKEKPQFIIWILLSGEVILNLQGLSLLSWIAFLI